MTPKQQIMMSHMEVLKLVDILFHRYASDYRTDAKADVNDYIDKWYDIQNANEQIKQIIVSLERGIVNAADLDPKLLELLVKQRSNK